LLSSSELSLSSSSSKSGRVSSSSSKSRPFRIALSLAPQVPHPLRDH
jgi:hypothetical protein